MKKNILGSLFKVCSLIPQRQMLTFADEILPDHSVPYYHMQVYSQRHRISLKIYRNLIQAHHPRLRHDYTLQVMS